MSATAGAKNNAACCGGQAVRLQHKVRDPLCGVPVAANSPYKLEREGRSQRFCSEACLTDYTRASQGQAVPGVAFTCAMHPESRQDQPGACALCEMTLAPVRAVHAANAPQGAAGSVLGRLRTALGL